MMLESLFIILINILIILILLKIIQILVSKLAKTSKDRIHTIYQGGELLQARQRRYQSNLYTLIVLFLILHVMVFMIASIALVQMNLTIAFEMIIFLVIFVYTIIIIRKGVNYS